MPATSEANLASQKRWRESHPDARARSLLRYAVRTLLATGTTKDQLARFVAAVVADPSPQKRGRKPKKA